MKDLYKCLSCGNLETTNEAPISCERCGSELMQRIPEGVSTSTRVEVLNGGISAYPAERGGATPPHSISHSITKDAEEPMMCAQFDMDVDG